jgi:[acyl-carrier-protein] S-malonyltransferase
MSELNNKLAFVFPGQGSQSIGMLADLAASEPEVQNTFDKASEVLGFDLWDMVCNGPADELNKTHNTQPAMLAAGFAVWQVWCKQSEMRPGWIAGHSLGEYTALVCSDALTFEDAIRLVEKRGHYMQESVPAGTGAMAAILGLKDSQVIDVCTEVAENEVVAAVNFNAPGQVVIAGNLSAVERAMIAAKDAGAKRAVKLPVSVPSHCSLMIPAAEKLDVLMHDVPFEIPDVKLIHNVDVKSHNEPEVIRRILKEQLYKPVRWVDTIKFLYEQGVTDFIECGPGKVLMGLNKRIAKSASHFTMYDPDSVSTVNKSLK